MKIHHELEERATGDRPIVLAIGFFDGLHRGHGEIVKGLLRLRKPGYNAAVLTFRNHPSTFLRPEHVPAQITTLAERVDLLAASGIDELYLIPFDERIASLDAHRFLEDVLLEQLNVKALVFGENFRFGKGREGDAALATETLRARAIEVAAIAPVVDEGERVSSTRVRSALGAGDFSTVNRLLGEPWALRGTVVIGRGRGHDLHFPTANLAVPKDKALPRDGVYQATARHDGRDYSALVSIGRNPTFGENPRTVEAWLLDFRRSIYGEELALRDFRFIREQKTFARIDDLIAQMHEDASNVRFPSFNLA